MIKWKNFCEKITDGVTIEALRELAGKNFEEYGVYPDSIQSCKSTYFFITKHAGEKVLVVYDSQNAQTDCYNKFTGDVVNVESGTAKICKLDVLNSKAIRDVFDFTNPMSHKGRAISVGLGDRLGLASVGHIRLVKGADVFPVLAQQSIRELTLTDRTYEDVLASAVWAVFQEGYTKGYGADGDHLKTVEEVKMAVDFGFTMITLDCSDHINNDIINLSDAEVDKLYASLGADERAEYEKEYLAQKFELKDVNGNNSNTSIEFETNELKRIVLTYQKAIKHTVNIYSEVIANCGRTIDFEMSIDETLTSTTPTSHFFVAKELLKGGVEIRSLAPRFCGEFQKGIDYRGDVNQFTKEFEIHCKIAKTLGYKISVHSGSDKFMVFPIIGEKTEGTYHLKTAGTNWLEAVRVIAENEPALYRKMHKFALSTLDEAKKYYHISADPSTIPDIDKLSDAELPNLMNVDDSRQVLHITYGLILTARDEAGQSMFKDAIYACLNKYEDSYNQALYNHIGKHLKLLGVKLA